MQSPDDDAQPDVDAPPTTRRAFLRTTVLAAFAAVIPQMGAGAATTTKKTTKPTATTRKKTTTTRKKATTTARKPTAATASGAVFDAAQELVIAFSFVASGGGRVLNPYVAVFVQNDAGDLVRTVHLSVNTSRKGLRYLRELRYWYQLDQTRQAKGGEDLVQTVSSATRVPGRYTVVWDGRDEQGALVPLGAYVLCIEASREHGPYELVTEPIVLDRKRFAAEPDDQGEIRDVVLELRARR